MTLEQASTKLSTPWHSVGLVTAVSVTGVMAGLMRLAAARTLPNDHYFYIAGANQVLTGEWPVRDFFDPGLPLTYFAGAFAQRLVGHPLLAEALIFSTAYGLAAALTVLAGYRLSGLVSLGLVAALIEVAMFPRTYSYPKVLCYVIGLLLMWGYLRAPSTWRLVWISVLVAVAGLFRHDHGLYLGVIAMMTVVTASAASLGQRLRRGLALVALTGALLTPFIAYVQVHEGIASYSRSALAFNRAERDRTRLPSMTFVAGRQLGEACGASRSLVPCFIESNAHPLVYYGFHALPVVAVVILVVRRLRRRATAVDRMVPAVVAAAVLVNWGFIRDPLGVRIADTIVPVVLLSAWIGGLLWRPPDWGRRTIAAALTSAALVLFWVVVTPLTGTRDYLDRTGLLTNPLRFPGVVAYAADELRTVRSPRHLPGDAMVVLEPFWRYVDWCTDVDDRILVPGFEPQINVVARRRFAGGRSTLLPRYNDSVSEQQLIVERLSKQVTPIVFVLSEWEGWEGSFPLVGQYVAERYSLAGELSHGGNRIAQVFLADSLTAGAPVDPETGWPCVAAGRRTPSSVRSSMGVD